MKAFFRFLAVGIFIAGILVIPLQAAHAETVKPLKIGILGPMSGPAVAWGLPAKHGVEIWVEDVTKCSYS